MSAREWHPDWRDDCQYWRGRLLTGRGRHWCWEWDGLPIDDTCPEWPCCVVAYRFLPRTLKKWATLGFPRTRRRLDRWRRRYFRSHVEPIRS